MDFWTSHVTTRRADRRVYVMATSEQDARAGLDAAGPLATAAGTSIVLLVPHLVPYGTEIDQCGHDLAQIGEEFRSVASASSVDVVVHVCACRDVRHVLAQMLVEGATVVVPGRRGTWRRTPAERLAKALECEGHRVVFVDVGAVERPAEDARLSGNRDGSAVHDGPGRRITSLDRAAEPDGRRQPGGLDRFRTS